MQCYWKFHARPLVPRCLRESARLFVLLDKLHSQAVKSVENYGRIDCLSMKDGVKAT